VAFTGDLLLSGGTSDVYISFSRISNAVLVSIKFVLWGHGTNFLTSPADECLLGSSKSTVASAENGEMTGYRSLGKGAQSFLFFPPQQLNQIFARLGSLPVSISSAKYGS
jgi:hypothetical protein